MGGDRRKKEEDLYSPTIPAWAHNRQQEEEADGKQKERLKKKDGEDSIT